ncbi:MAG: response regulator transcription factor [Eubacterium sp.]|nr:response regulator transcription factor [Eubacterium sp.]
MYKVMIVDDQSISRQLFEMYVNSSKDFELAFSVTSAGVADVYLLKNKVDLVIMDILMNDGSNGLIAAQIIKKLYPDIKIIAVTSMPEYSWLDKAREIGIDSFWYKESDENTIIGIMKRTMEGDKIYPDRVPVVDIGNAKSVDFTERELEVLKIIATGVSNAEVAKKLDISEYTVKSHVRNMLEKTGFRSRTELAIKARTVGITIPI